MLDVLIFFIGLTAGVNLGIILMCCFQINRIDKYEEIQNKKDI